jgi:hypothetical protein
MPIGQQTSWGSGAESKRPPGADSVSRPPNAAALVDRGDLQRFFEALFRYAAVDSYVSLRTFHQHDRGKPPLSIKGVKVGDPRLIDEIEASTVRAANVAAATVFAPPVATFDNPKRAARRNLANGLAQPWRAMPKCSGSAGPWASTLCAKESIFWKITYARVPDFDGIAVAPPGLHRSRSITRGTSALLLMRWFVRCCSIRCRCEPRPAQHVPVRPSARGLDAVVGGAVVDRRRFARRQS